LLGGVIALLPGNPRVSILMNAQPQKNCEETCYCSLNIALYRILPPCSLA
jgi:hypothetical protein